MFLMMIVGDEVNKAAITRYTTDDLSAGTLLLHLAGKGHIHQKAKSTFHRWFQGAAVKQNNRCAPTHTALIVSLESHSHTEGLSQ